LSVGEIKNRKRKRLPSQTQTNKHLENCYWVGTFSIRNPVGENHPVADHRCPKCDQILSPASFSEKRCEHCGRVLPEYILNAGQEGHRGLAKERVAESNTQLERGKRNTIRGLGLLLLLIVVAGFVLVTMMSAGKSFQGATGKAILFWYFWLAVFFLLSLWMIVKGKLSK